MVSISLSCCAARTGGRSLFMGLFFPLSWRTPYHQSPVPNLQFPPVFPAHILFTIQPTRSTRSSSSLTLSRPPVTSHFMFSNRAISITGPCLWNDLPPELRTISSPPPPSLPITGHHLHLPPLSVTPRAFHSKLKSYLFKHSYPDPSDHSPSPSQQHPP